MKKNTIISLWASGVPLIAFLLVVLPQCTFFSDKQESLGSTEPYKGFIPSQIIVAPCLVWPAKVLYNDRTQSNTSPKQQKDLCKQFDKFVLKSFTNQPFMKGYSPKALSQFLKKHNHPNYLEEIPKIWESSPILCSHCEGPIATFKEAVSPLPNWKKWLLKLSKMSLYSDTYLQPIVVSVQEQNLEDKTRLLSKRSAEVVLLLLDVNNSNIVWRSKKASSILAENDASQKKGVFPPPPPWERLRARLFNESIWLDFPGRIHTFR